MDNAAATADLAALVPLALASAFMPARTLMTARMMLTRHPVPNALAYIAGNWVWRVFLGVAVLLTLGFDATGVALWAGETLRWIAGVLSVVFAVLAVAQWRLGRRLNEIRIRQWSERLDGLGPGPVFVATLAVMWIPGAQWLLVIAGAGVIHASGVSAPLQVLALVLFSAGQLVMVASPVFMTDRARQRGEAIWRGADQLRMKAADKGFVAPALLSVFFALVALGSLTR